MFRLAKNIWLSPIVGDASQKTHNLKHNTNNMSSARSESKMATKIVQDCEASCAVPRSCFSIWKSTVARISFCSSSSTRPHLINFIQLKSLSSNRYNQQNETLSSKFNFKLPELKTYNLQSRANHLIPPTDR